MKKKYTKILLLCAMSLIAFSAMAQKEQKAKEILDKVSDILSKDNGIKATFRLKNYRMNKLSEQTEGSLSLKGNRFILETPGTTTWFNGKTQWTYIAENEEINISTPTREELQSINPYSFIHLYKKGYAYQTNGTVQYKGKNAYKIILISESDKQDISKIELLIQQDNFQPVSIEIRSRKGEKTQIEILSYQSKQNLSDDSFTLNTKQYPRAEVIDLR